MLFYFFAGRCSSKCYFG